MNKNNNQKVLVAMSGGVDSAVAAALLKKAGYQVSGMFLHFWKDDSQPGLENKCCSLKSLSDAKEVCRAVGIPLNTFDFRAPFKKIVVDNFLSEYQKGRTPNPCVVCNKNIKIGRLLKYARSLGFDYVATGHYVKLQKSGGKIKMFKAKDKNKDQSYFLYTFNQDELKHLMFPLADYTKPQVRALAKKFKLPVAEKAESQEICFVSSKHHNDFLKKYLKLKSGQIQLIGGPVIGEHDGLPLFTIGQRRGINIGGNGPYYAADFDFKKNILYVAKTFDDAKMYGQKLMAKNVNWINGGDIKKVLKCQAVIRYRHQAVPVEIVKKGSAYEVRFKTPQRAITPGQSVVFYKGQEVLGGGIIK